jgi:hypothetical protein
MKVAYATIIDARYLPRGLALQMSIARHDPCALFAFFCMDDLSEAQVEYIQLPQCRTHIESVFSAEPLRAVRPQRSVAEYCWTAKPFVLSHLLAAEPGVDWVAYLDSDMLSFGDPGAALTAAGNADFLLSPHRFSQEFVKFAPTVGTYNAGFAAFRDSATGREALGLWARLCLESCSVQVTASTYADQKYLDNLMAAYPTGRASGFSGLNAAPWNIGNHRVTGRDGGVWLDDDPLLLYHFQGMRLLNRRWVDLYAGDYHLDPAIRNLIYRPYLQQLSEAYRRLRDRRPGFDLGFNPLPPKWDWWLLYVKRIVEGNSNVIRAQLYS